MNTAETDLIPLNRIARLIRSPAPPHISTIMRWVFRGVGRPPVKLATVKVGGRRYTTEAAVEAFIAATSGPSANPRTTNLPGRRAAHTRAEHLLDADGLR
jgi:hypothetical protein